MGEKQVILFKSNQQFFYVERSGRKPNTERFTDDWDEKRRRLFLEATHVIIQNPSTGEVFEREISYRCSYKNLAIICWISNYE